MGVAEFEVHAAADVLQLEHGASPGGTGDGDLYGLRAELRVARQKSFAAAEEHGGVAVVHRLNAKNGVRWKIVEKNSTLDFRLDDAAVDFVGEVGMRTKHANYQRIG